MTAVGLDEAEQAVLDAIDDDELTRLLVDLVTVPSVTASDAEHDLQHRLAAVLTAADLDVDLWSLDVAALAADPAFPGTEMPRTQGYGLVGTAPARADTGPPALVLQGHVDVVPVGAAAGWAGRDPFSAAIIGGDLHGRGACDMKAGVAANIAVIRAIRRAGLVLERPLALHLVVSEEDGGLGAFATLRRGHTGAAAVISEPTGGRIVTASAGALTFRLEIIGQAAHGATRYEGTSAFEAFLPVQRALVALEHDRNRLRDNRFGDNPLPYPLSIGMIHTGDWASTVPDRLVADGRFGVRLGEDPAHARAEFERAVTQAALSDPWLAAHPPAVSWPGGQFASGQTTAGHPLIGQMQDSVARVSGQRPSIGAVPYGSDLRLYEGVGGIPTLHYGPGDVRLAHAPRERVALAEVAAVARALAVLTVRRCLAHR